HGWRNAVVVEADRQALPAVWRGRVDDVVAHLDPAHARAVAPIGADHDVRVLRSGRGRTEPVGRGEARLDGAAREAAADRPGLARGVGERRREDLVAEAVAGEDARLAEALRARVERGGRHRLIDVRVDGDTRRVLAAPALLGVDAARRIRWLEADGDGIRPGRSDGGQECSAYHERDSHEALLLDRERER